MIHVYTGDGKGKTTAAVGLVVRAVGRGKRAVFFQFMKAWPSGEVGILQRLGVLIDREWNGKFIGDAPTKKQQEMVRSQYGRVLEIFKKNFEIVVLDEILVAMHFGLLEERDIIFLMQNKPKNVELILTGRGATEAIIQKADLVTKMQKIKHYFDKGIEAREGIEY